MSDMETEDPPAVPVAIRVIVGAESPPPEGLTDQMRDDALTLLRAGKAEQASQVVQLADRMDTITTPIVTIGPLTEDEQADLALLQQEHADQQAAQDAADTAKAALVEKLTAGTATGDEVQQAIAQLLA